MRSDCTAGRPRGPEPLQSRLSAATSAARLPGSGWGGQVGTGDWEQEEEEEEEGGWGVGGL